ncbi:hypothetical protein [Streptomyces flavidovirens]|uniref:hypothetical protein n=1 Tax=Streptomyces flavidovirens TaxID=67298 RepID=UPI00367B9735
MTAPTIDATWAPTAESRLLADALTDAQAQVAAAPPADTRDLNALAASHTALLATVRRLLWVHNAEEGS